MERAGEEECDPLPIPTIREIQKNDTTIAVIWFYVNDVVCYVSIKNGDFVNMM